MSEGRLTPDTRVELAEQPAKAYEPPVVEKIDTAFKPAVTAPGVILRISH